MFVRVGNRLVARRGRLFVPGSCWPLVTFGALAMSAGSFVSARFAVPVTTTPSTAVRTVALPWPLFALSAAFRRR
jgi:hypothetical protein